MQDKTVGQGGMYTSTILIIQMLEDAERTAERAEALAVCTGLAVHSTLLVDILFADLALGCSIWRIPGPTPCQQSCLHSIDCKPCNLKYSRQCTAATALSQNLTAREVWKGDTTCLASLCREACSRSISCRLLLSCFLLHPEGEDNEVSCGSLSVSVRLPTVLVSALA